MAQIYATQRYLVSEEMKDIAHIREWWCLTCNTKEPMTTKQLKEHLKEIHQLDGKVSGRRQLEIALDGDEYMNNFTWTLPNGIKLTEVQSGPK